MRADRLEVCIVGAGLAGSLLAYELGRRGLRVVVLETGPRFDPSQRPEVLRRMLEDGTQPWPPDPVRDAYVTGGSIAYPLNEARVKAVGGTTLHWGAIARRLYEDDFRLRQSHGLADDWPISYAEIEPYYGRAEVALGVAGAADNPFESRRSSGYPLPPFPFSYGDGLVRQACERLGIAICGTPCARNSRPYQQRPQCMAFATCTTHRLCPVVAMYTAETHATLAEATGNVTILTRATARRLNLDANGAVESVGYTRADGSLVEQPARIFVVAAHTVESARLLLLSRSSRFPHGLANGSGAVGKHFMEHPCVTARGRLKQRTFPHRIGFPTAECHQFCVPRDRSATPSFKLTFMNTAGPTPAELAAASGQWGGVLAEEIRANFGDWVEIRAYLEQLPAAENAVGLDASAKDDFGDPVTRISYSLGDYEREGREHAVAAMTRILEAMGATDVLFSFENEVMVSGHHLGTCRMGDDPATSVVDRDLRAHEVPNLYLTGGSVFVSGGAVNPSLTIAALTLRAAETIAAQTQP